jgi:acyl-CoA thioester hydrolase
MFFDCDYRVCYGDTDQMGVVYYANYFTFFERGRTEMLRSVGFPYSRLEQLGVFLPVTEAKCRYFAPARYDDLVTLRSTVLELGRVRLRIGTQVRLNDRVLVSGEVTLASVNADRKPVRVAKELEDACRKYSLSPGEEWR